MTAVYRELDKKSRPIVTVEEEEVEADADQAAPATPAPAQPSADRPSPYDHTPLDLGTKRSQQAAPVPTRPKLGAREWLAILATIGLLVTAAIVLLFQPATAQENTAATAIPSRVSTSAPATLVPSSAAAIHDGDRVLTWPLDAYDASGHWVGPISAGRPFSVREPAGTEWMIIEAPAWNGAPASGQVRVYAVDLISQPPARPTPLPTQPPPPPVYQPAPAEEAAPPPTWMPPPLPTMAPTPPPCANCKPKEPRDLHRRPYLDDPSLPTNGAGGVLPAKVAHAIGQARQVFVP